MPPNFFSSYATETTTELLDGDLGLEDLGEVDGAVLALAEFVQLFDVARRDFGRLKV